MYAACGVKRKTNFKRKQTIANEEKTQSIIVLRFYYSFKKINKLRRFQEINSRYKANSDWKNFDSNLKLEIFLLISIVKI